MKRRKRLSPVSSKRREANVARAELRASILGHPSVRCVVQGCREQPSDLHEPLTRARGGSPLDPNNVVPVCRTHHRWIHDHPQAAYEAGLLKHSWEAP